MTPKRPVHTILALNRQTPAGGSATAKPCVFKRRKAFWGWIRVRVSFVAARGL
jgi:hypothetical protein